MKSRFIRVTNPFTVGLWDRFLRTLAGLIYEPYRKRTNDWFDYFFKNEYMTGVHQHYSRESHRLNVVISKKVKKVRQLEAKVKALETEIKELKESGNARPEFPTNKFVRETLQEIRPIIQAVTIGSTPPYAGKSLEKLDIVISVMKAHNNDDHYP